VDKFAELIDVGLIEAEREAGVIAGLCGVGEDL
jgi:hypothetical protein